MAHNNLKDLIYYFVESFFLMLTKSKSFDLLMFFVKSFHWLESFAKYFTLLKSLVKIYKKGLTSYHS